MNYDDLNNFILNYLDNDITGRAIMLTSGWGSGKSYYVKNNLKTFLEDKKHGKHKCVIVSLYGLTSTYEISKAIYTELRSFKLNINKNMNKLNKKNEFLATAGAAASIVPKTLVNSITSHIGYDIGQVSDRQLQKVYDSVNLKGKLLIFEDIERTNIDIIDLLGYINNICENDGAKVLLVANEKEILTTYEKTDEQGKVVKKHTDKALKYMRAKEKTVGDTIYFNCDFINAILQIIDTFKPHLQEFKNRETAKEIHKIFIHRNSNNLRTFKFACQKAADILNIIHREDSELNKTIFLGTIAFSLDIKNGNIPNWNAVELVSFKLGTDDYPLYRFCYNYILWHEFNSDLVDSTVDIHKKMKLFKKNGSDNDADLKIIFSCLVQTEHDVMNALSNVERRLSKPEDISIYDYSKLASYLILCNSVLGYDYSSCQEKMIKNIRGMNEEIEADLFWSYGFDFENEDEKNKYADFMAKIKESMNSINQNEDFFSYNPSDLQILYYQITGEKNKYTRNHIFISNFDIDKLVKMLFECNPSQLSTFREIMFAIYRYATSNDYLEDDIIAMKSLKNKIQDRLSNIGSDFDKIALKQFQMVIRNLDTFIGNLSK